MGESASGSKPKPNSNSTEPVYAKDEAYLQSIIPKRIMLFELLQSEQRLKRTALPDELIRITLPDGKVKEGKKSKISPLDVAKEISKSLASNALIAKVNGVLWDMSRPLEEDCKLELYTFETEEGRDTFWHSSAHILGESLEQTYGCRLCIGPCTTRGEGFHYDAFYGDLELNEDHFKQIEAAAKKAIDEKQPFDRIEVTRHQALYMFSDNPFKVEIIKDLPEDKTITVYRCGPLVDLCRGPHIPNTSFVKAFSCLKASSAYWRGNKDRESLQRVYGISFPDQEHLKPAYIRLPVRTKFPKITTYWRDQLPEWIKKMLGRRGGNNLVHRFMDGQFGHLLQWRKGKNAQHALHQLMCYEVQSEPGEVRFHISGVELRFSQLEYALVTGLLFGNSGFNTEAPRYPRDSDVYIRLTNGQPISGGALTAMVRDDTLPDNLHEDDYLKVANVAALMTFFFAPADTKKVDTWIWVLADDLDAWNAFPWGSYTYNALLYYLTFAPKRAELVKSKYNLYGPIWALQIWAYEAIPVLGRQCVRLINEDSMPRMTKWVYHQTQDTDWVSFFASEMQPLPHATLTPTPKEQQTAYWISVTGENSLQVSFPMPVPVQPRPEHSVSFPTPVPVQSRSALADEPSQAARPQRSKRAASRECLTIDHSFPDIQMGPSTDGQEVPTADEEHPRRAKEARLDDEGISRQNRSIPRREYEIMLTMLEERWEKREQTFFRREEDMLKKVNEHWDKREKQFFSKVGDMFKKVFGRGM